VYAGATFRALSHRPTKSCSDRTIGTSRTAGSKATFVLGRYATRALLAFSPACSLNSHRASGWWTHFGRVTWIHSSN
jgi:hypothetical protein